MLRPADFDTEKIRVIKHWKEKVIDSMNDTQEVTKAFLIAASVICELCVKDVYEQVVPLFSYLQKEDTQTFLRGLSTRHDIIFISKELGDLTDGEYYFPKLCDALDGREMESILYTDEGSYSHLDKDSILKNVEAYIRCHDEFLDDYDQKRYKLKSNLDD